MHLPWLFALLTDNFTNNPRLVWTYVQAFLTENKVDISGFTEKSELAAAAKAEANSALVSGNGLRAEVQVSRLLLCLVFVYRI